MKFDYEIVYADTRHEIAQKLREHGAEGWRLAWVSISKDEGHPRYEVFMERELEIARGFLPEPQPQPRGEIRPFAR